MGRFEVGHRRQKLKLELHDDHAVGPEQVEPSGQPLSSVEDVARSREEAGHDQVPLLTLRARAQNDPQILCKRLYRHPGRAATRQNKISAHIVRRDLVLARWM